MERQQRERLRDWVLAQRPLIDDGGAVSIPVNRHDLLALLDYCDELEKVTQ